MAKFLTGINRLIDESLLQNLSPYMSYLCIVIFNHPIIRALTLMW